MSEQLEHPLCNELDHWSNVIRLRYRDFMIALTALELDAAQRHLSMFSILLSTMSEQSAVFLRQLKTAEGDDIRMLRADDLILKRSSDKAAELLIQLQTLASASGNPERQLRGQLVDRLDGFVRVDNILARHHQRQQETLYPLYSEQFNAAVATQHADDLSGRMHQATPH